MPIPEIQSLCESHKIHMTKSAYEYIESSINSGKYTLDQVRGYIEKDPASYRDLYNYRDLFKKTVDTSLVKDAESLKYYADQLGVSIPEKTFDAMSLAIREGRNSPSQLANYLRGHAYEQFLQSKNVPHLSDAEISGLKQNMGKEASDQYLRSLEKVSRAVNIPQTALHQVVDEYSKDRRDALALYEKIVSNSPPAQLEKSQDSIVKYSKSIGVTMDESKAQFLIDIQLTKEEIAKHIVHSSFERFSKGPEQFKSQVESLSKTQNKQMERGIEL
jgi:hypothetical protein